MHKKLNIEKIIIQVVLSKVLLNIFMKHALNDFWHKIKMYNFEPCNVLLAIATNIPVLQDQF